MRIRFSEDEDFNNASILWEANQERSLKSRHGQQALRRLEAALLALQEPKLVADAIEDADGLVCGLGALAKHEGYQGSLELPEASWNDWGDGPEVEDAMLALAGSLNVPKLVAVAIIRENDGDYRVKTPEQRYSHMLAWTRSWLSKDRSMWTQKNMEGYIA
jgi:hypothetical protein